MLECVINVSEGRRAEVLGPLRDAAGDALLDVHADRDHNRSVFTIAGPDVEDAARCLARCAVQLIDLRAHEGVHPRLGALDVVPFVPLGGATMADALGARHRFACWAADAMRLPCFLYGPERSLPQVRRRAFVDLAPDLGPAEPHPVAGAVAVGARSVLVAYNVWLDSTDVATAKAIATEIRSAAIRALGLRVGGAVQVSMNLVDPAAVGPAAAYDAVARRARVSRAELVGLLPAAVLEAVPPARWEELDLSPARTIEARLQEAGLEGGRFPPR